MKTDHDTCHDVEGAARTPIGAEIELPYTRLDKALRWTLLVTIVLSLLVLAYGAVMVYDGQPPIPNQLRAPQGTVLATKNDINAGRDVFQRTDLMDFGSLYGNGSYFGPDWGTDYLHRQIDAMRSYDAQKQFKQSYASLSPAERATIDTLVKGHLRTNHYVDGTVTLTDDEAAAYLVVRQYYRQLFIKGDKEMGLPADTVQKTSDADLLTSFFAWTSWTSVTPRPGQDFSYTNNWPYEPAAGNVPTANTFLWSWASLISLVLVALAVYFLYRWLFPAKNEKEPVRIPLVEARAPTPSQYATGKWFVIVPLLLFVQSMAGTLMAHYYADRSSWLSVAMLKIMPFNTTKAWHIQLAIFWIAAAWMGTGLFLAPIIGKKEPRFQKALVNILWVAVVAVVALSSLGVWLGVKLPLPDSLWAWVGNQGLEYLQLGKLFQILVLVALLAWGGVLARAFWPGLRNRRTWTSVEHLLLYSGLAIGITYFFGLLPLDRDAATMTTIDFWRWWVVHSWVEGTFEFFTVAAVGYATLRMGLISRRALERTILFELILVLGTGLVGIGHHYYWVADPAGWMALGSMFSIMEIVPLTVMMIGAWKEYRQVRSAGKRFPQRVAFLFFTSAAVWNLVGAGLLGEIINPPIINYYEHGEFMTLAHAHASMMGVFGILAFGLIYYCLREMVTAEFWNDKLSTWVMHCFNAGIVLWVVLSLAPIGIAQFIATMNQGYWYARSLDFYNQYIAVQWLRLPGDLVFFAGIILAFIDIVQKLRHRRQPQMLGPVATEPELGPITPADPAITA